MDCSTKTRLHAEDSVFDEQMITENRQCVCYKVLIKDFINDQLYFRTQGRRLVGAGESTELWWPLKLYFRIFIMSGHSNLVKPWSMGKCWVIFHETSSKYEFLHGSIESGKRIFLSWTNFILSMLDLSDFLSQATASCHYCFEVQIRSKRTAIKGLFKKIF